MRPHGGAVRSRDHQGDRQRRGARSQRRRALSRSRRSLSPLLRWTLGLAERPELVETLSLHAPETAAEVLVARAYDAGSSVRWWSVVRCSPDARVLMHGTACPMRRSPMRSRARRCTSTDLLVPRCPTVDRRTSDSPLDRWQGFEDHRRACMELRQRFEAEREGPFIPATRRQPGRARGLATEVRALPARTAGGRREPWDSCSSTGPGSTRCTSAHAARGVAGASRRPNRTSAASRRGGTSTSSSTGARSRSVASPSARCARASSRSGARPTSRRAAPTRSAGSTRSSTLTSSSWSARTTAPW
jgi:hypothetical protein